MADNPAHQRRGFLATAASGAALLLAACARTGQAGSHSPKASAGQEDEEVAPGEDLMREHGILRRVLFLYDEAAARLEGGVDPQPEIVVGCAGIIRRVIESYHEKIEEEFVFPRLEAARQQLELVATLRQQHVAGRRVTDAIQAQARGPLRDAQDRNRLAAALRSFNRMYRPHSAREDTVLFPAFHKLLGGHAYDELGEQFEEQEHKLLGPRGFEDAVAEVQKLEAAYGFEDLSKFTPA